MFQGWWIVATHFVVMLLATGFYTYGFPLIVPAVIEDFGDDTFTRLLNSNHDELDLYRLATDALLALHNHVDGARIDLPRRETTFVEEAGLFCDWFYPAKIGHKCPPAIRGEFVSAWLACLANRPGSNDVLVLRDFHVDNAMLLPDRRSVRRCGLLDFQDAAIGPAAYDVMSLLEDARRDVSASVYDNCLEHYLQHSAVANKSDDFRIDCAILAAQRHTRVAGVFARLAKRDNKPHYLHHLPRVTRLLRKHLSHPALTPVTRWFEKYFPHFDNEAL